MQNKKWRVCLSLVTGLLAGAPVLGGPFGSAVSPLTAGCPLPPGGSQIEIQPSDRPETWFHVIGGNTSKAGLTVDLEAIAAAGYGGIQFFHGQVGKAAAWAGTTEQIPCLSPKWDDLVRHAAAECRRLGLTFRMQNCPGWSMSGGPWIKPSEAMRKIVCAQAEATARVPEIAVPANYTDTDSDWQDVGYLAFPTPEGAAAALTNYRTVELTGGNTNEVLREFVFEKPVTVRTLELPSPRLLNHNWSYNPDTRVRFEAWTAAGAWRVVCEADYRQGCWQDAVPFSLACAEESAARWRLSLTSRHGAPQVKKVQLFSAARLDNWEGESAHILRGLMPPRAYTQSPRAYIARERIRRVTPGAELGPGRWTILRLGHVNMKKKNAPAPQEATGWECDKLDPRGIEANFAGYIGRLAKDVLPPGALAGMIVDSWECERPTWTWKMPAYFKEEMGYEVWPHLPALFGWVIESPEATRCFLRDWRQTIGALIARNYYGRMAELAHAAGLDVAYETALGDVACGDILAYWKYCDTPMCEFWQPYDPSAGGVGHPNFKPVRPCVSAAHLYGKKRVACESFTSTRLTWNENFRTLKEQAVRHYARGVTHLVTHTFTHNPQLDQLPPGTSFGTYIGTPFIRKQTWWSFMPYFTKWMAECGAFLERGLPDVQVLRYLGDAVDHKPDELEYFPAGHTCDYLNGDALRTRLAVKGGSFVLPNGASYARIWIPTGTFLLPETENRLAELARQGGVIVRGSADDAVAGLEKQVAAAEGLLWYPRLDHGTNLYFVAAAERGFQGPVSFRTERGRVTQAFNLAPFENRLLSFPLGRAVSPRAADDPLGRAVRPLTAGPYQLSFPAGWGAPASMILTNLVAWKDLPGVSAEGRAFSGTATYRTVFTVPKRAADKPCRLNLGTVYDFARVFVNGKEAAVLWAEPYACDIAPFLRAGENELRIKVTSTWYNRLLFDKRQPPARRKTWTIWDISSRPPPCFLPETPLAPSGLLGPVTIAW